MKREESRFIRACFQRNEGRCPVWLMRQAGRYMEEYRLLRKRYSFKELVQDPNLVYEVTMLPIDLLGVDAAILFCDILYPLEIMGVRVEFREGGPVVLGGEDEGGIKRLVVGNPYEKLGYVFEGIRLVKEDLRNRNIPLIGFGGGPFTLFAYLLEGGGSSNFKRAKLFLNTREEESHELLEKITEVMIGYLRAQVECGVDAIQIFDTWAGILSYEDCVNYALSYLKRLIAGVKREGIPMIIFSKSNGGFYQDLGDLGVDVVSLDWNVSLSRVVKDLGSGIGVQGNLDPNILYSERGRIRQVVGGLLKLMGGNRGYIFNLGHGVLPDIPFDNVRYLVDIVKELGEIYSRGIDEH